MANTATSSSCKAKLQWLLSPWTLVGALATGVFFGVKAPEMANTLAPIGDSYLKLLQMCVLPIMVTAIISSVARLLSSGMSGRMLRRLLVVFVLGLLIAAGIGLTAGVAGKPGTNLDQAAQTALGKLISSFGAEGEQIVSPDMELYLKGTQHAQEETPGFFQDLIPKNIFQALHKGHTLQILIFALLLGTALSSISAERRDGLLDSLDAIFQAFLLIIHWLMYLLPLGLLFLIAHQVAGMGMQTLSAMTKYIILVYAGCLVLVLLNAGALAMSTRTGFFRSFQLLRQPLLISFFTRNSYAAMPAAIEALQDNFGVKKDTTSLVIPLGITVCRFGTVMVFALSVVFLAQLFTVPLDPLTIAFIGGASVIAGVAAAGAPGVVAITMISIVLTPLGLPMEVALVLLLAVDPITDPALTCVNVQTNCAACALIQGRAPETALKPQGG